MVIDKNNFMEYITHNGDTLDLRYEAQIKSISYIPDTIKTLLLDSNHLLTNICDIPNNVEALQMCNVSDIDFPILPKNLKKLYLVDCKLHNWFSGELPKNLRSITIFGCNFFINNHSSGPFDVDKFYKLMGKYTLLNDLIANL